MLNRSRFILNSFRPLENTLLDNTKILTTQQKRTTYILKRKYPPGLHRKEGPPYGEKLKHRHFIYEVVENTSLRRQKSLDVILLTYVEGIGEKGDRVSLKPRIAYNSLLLPGLATYASPENIAKYERPKDEVREKAFTSPFVERTMNVLSTMLLSVIMNIETPWTLEKWHIRTSFRRAGAYVPEEAITMPEKTISGPNLDIENKEFYVTVTINKKEQVKVRCRIHHFHINSALQLPPVNKFYCVESSPIFPEDKEVLDSMPRHRLFKNSSSTYTPKYKVSP